MTTDRQITISPSQMISMECRLAWHWQYQSGYRSKEPNSNLAFGTAIHAALEEHYNGWDPIPAFEGAWLDQMRFSTNDDEKDAKLKLGRLMLEKYKETYGKVEDEPFTVIDTEEMISRPIPHPQTLEPSEYNLVCRLDGRVQDKTTGEIMSLEHKTYTSLNEKAMLRDMQYTAQIWLSGAGSVLYNGLRKTKRPAFHRATIRRSRREIDIMLHRAYYLAKEFNTKDLEIFPQPSPMRCGMCEYQEPCLSYMTSGDHQSKLQSGYNKRGEK